MFRKRCAPRFHAERTGSCVEISHGESISAKNVISPKRCAPRFHAECTGHCVESFHEEPIREKNVIFKKVASWYPGIPVRGSASSLFSRFAGSHPFTSSPIRFASVFPVPGSRFRSGSEPCCHVFYIIFFASVSDFLDSRNSLR